MPTTVPTPEWALDRVDASQANADVTLNSAMNRIDSLIGLWRVKNITTTAPPGSPAEGDAYQVAAGGSGAWAGKDGQMAVYFAGWIFFPAKFGTIRYNQSDDSLYLFESDSTWHQISVA